MPQSTVQISDKPKVGDYAFWDYDKFPYCLAAKVLQVKDKPDGRISIKPEGYGNYFFYASFWLPHDRGKELWEQLRILQNELSKKRLQLQVEMGQEAKFLFEAFDVPVNSSIERLLKS